MAEHGGGYDLDFVDPPPDSLVCLICTCVAKGVQQLKCCGKVLCKGCLGKVVNNKCPQCRKKIVTTVDLRGEKEVKSLRVKCTNTENGCQWVGELGDFERTHQQKCKHYFVSCPNDCKETDGTPLQVLFKDLDKHTTNECSRRPYSCPKCEEEGEFVTMTTSHVDQCPQVNVHCPNLLCELVVLRCNLATHRTTCAYERVRCKYSEIGCEEKPMRKDLQDHENNDQLHLHIAMETIVPLNKKVKVLQDNLHIAKPYSKFSFKVFGFDSKKQNDNIFYSPSFYSSQNGYKMCIIVDTNGSGNGKGTNVSVFACLMKGDNDDSLTWPFTGTVRVELLNQLEDKNHYKMTIAFPADDNDVSGRVVDGERGRGYGIPEFIPHTDLDYKRDKNCQYLKDDTLVFRVIVKLPKHKSWLECMSDQ